jgi:intracellular sulfur oxidation DsrE/DsrF family protein
MQTRADFLATGALAALAATPSPKPEAKPAYPPLGFDTKAFDDALKSASNGPAAHRHMFAAQRIDSGQVFGTMQGVLDAYASTGVDVATVASVAILYHGMSVVLALDDAMWNRYVLPNRDKAFKEAKEQAKDLDSVYDASTKGNPCLHRTNKEDDASIERLTSEGSRFFVCNHALQGVASFLARGLKADKLTVYRDLAAHLVPRSMLVPAGIWAVHAIQERGYTYQQVNLQP